MREYLVTLLISAALCYLSTPLVRTQAIRFGAVAGIRGRDIHTTPTARWGGVAMWLAMAITFMIVNHLPLVGKSFGHEAQGIFLASTAIVLLGMADDRFQLDALTKLTGQVFAAGILLMYGIQILWLPINAVNFIDGMDGLAAGIVAISGIAFFAFAYLLAVDYGFSRAGAPSLTTAVLVGLCIGFLPHNAHPARIFMGDSGSMLLGLLLASAAITLTGQVDPNAISAESRGPTLLPLLLPFAVLAIPLVDLLLAVARRVKAGKSPFAPDNEHLHHRLLSAGNSQLKTAFILYMWTATIAFPVTVLAFQPWWVALITAAVLVAISVTVSRKPKKVSA
jgi:UDP-GlcNAc:undecaprenyl-phosphate GlcNAc-1-phosphate transferase